MRFPERMVRQTLSDYLEVGLAERGWIDEPRNFGIEGPVRLIDVDRDDLIGATAELTVELRERLEGNVVAITIEDEGDDRLQELGGHVYSTVMVVAIDVWGDLSSVTSSLASDVKALLRDAFINVRDYTVVGAPTTDDYIEPEVVRIVRPSTGAIEFRKRWRTVTLDALVTFTDRTP